MTTKFAVVALAGIPNAGKSTLLNAIVGQKLSVISKKPQSTRQAVRGIYTKDDTQLVFVDPPGLLDPSSLLQTAMMELATRTLNEAHIVLHLHPAPMGEPEQLMQLVPDAKLADKPIGTVLTKIDVVHEELLRSLRSRSMTETFLVSAQTGEGIADVVDWCCQRAGPGDFAYDPDDISTQPVRFFVEEFVREAAFEILAQELPYALAAEVDEFREGSKAVYIRVVLYVERESQKGMVIGRRGQTIKTLGKLARRRTEALIGQPVYLDLWVKVLPKWRAAPQALERFGLPVSDDSTRT